jgi:hypothetical protein
MPQLLSVLNEIGEATDRIGEQARGRTEEMEIAVRPPPDLSQVRRITRRMSEELIFYAKIIENKTPALGLVSNTIFGALSNALILQQDFKQPNADELLDLYMTTCTMLENTRQAKGNILIFRNVVAGLPHITLDLNRAKRTTVKALDDLVSELDKIESLIIDISAAVERMVHTTSGC